MSVEDLRVPGEQLANVCNADDLGFETTDEIVPLEGTIGQERAISALELSLDIDDPGFNLFISGPPGTGRNTALRSRLEGIAEGREVPPDWGYVHNFQDPSQPVAISLPCGMMRELVTDMNDLVDSCRREIPSVFDSDDYTHRVEEVMREVQEKRQQMTAELEEAAQKEGFTLSFAQIGITPAPMNTPLINTSAAHMAIVTPPGKIRDNIQIARPSIMNPNAPLMATIHGPAFGNSLPCAAPTASSGAPMPRLIANSANPPRTMSPLCAMTVSAAIRAGATQAETTNADNAPMTSAPIIVPLR